jgi:hypothetical protein
MGYRAAALLVLVVAPSHPAAAQQGSPTVLVVRQAGREIGREEFTLAAGRARGATGSTLTATAKYPPTAPTTRLAAVLERTPEAALAKFQLDVDGPGGTTVILAAGSGARLIVRTVAKGSESGRELPGGPDVVLLDEQVYSLLAQVADLATPAGRPLTAIYPRTGRRLALVARRGPGGEAGSTRTALSGDLSATIVTDAAGRVVRVEVPGQDIVVQRAE